MKILVTGAAGFIGFHLVQALLAEGRKVVGIDNINNYYDVNLKYARLQVSGINRPEILNEGQDLVRSEVYPDYSFQRLDVLSSDKLDKLFKEQAFDLVFHMAAQPGVRYSLENPHAYVQTNIVGFMNILECCKKYQVKHLIYASSSSVYGMSDKIPFSEEDCVDYPVSLYAATKKSTELLAHTYSHLYQLPTSGLRFFTVYGPWGRPDMAPMLFAEAIYKGESIKVFNSGDMLRDFTYVEDIVAGIIKVAEKIPDSLGVHPFYRLFNIGNSRPIKLLDFIMEMERAIGIKAMLQMYPMQKGDVKITYASTKKLEDLTGYRPNTSLEEGLENFIGWYKKYKNHAIPVSPKR